MVSRTASTLEKELDALDAERSQSHHRLHDELAQIPLLAPWTTHVAHDPSFSPAQNDELAARVHQLLLEQLTQSYLRLKRLQDESNASGIISRRATRTLLESRLVVEAKRKINLAQLTQDIILAMQTANDTRSTNASLCRPSRVKPRTSSNAPASGASLRRRTRAPDSTAAAAVDDPNEDKDAVAVASIVANATEQDIARLFQDHSASSTITSSSEMASRDKEEYQVAIDPLSVQFAPATAPLSELVAHAQAQQHATTPPDEQHVTSFRHRGVSPLAVNDAAQPVVRREDKPDRVRYIMSTRPGALPPTKKILDEYPIPREILEALERHRHYHVDEASLMSSFDSLRVGASDSEWECYFRRSVPVERKPVSFVLSSLKLAHERAEPPPSDLFQQHVLDQTAGRDDDLLLSEVSQLYDHTHDALRSFRSELHHHLDLNSLVLLAFRTSLNSASYFLDEDVVNSEPTVEVPEYLRRKPNASIVLKWRLAKNGAMSHLTTKRGAAMGAGALRVQGCEHTRADRHEAVTVISLFSPSEVQLMNLWRADRSGEQGGQPDVPFDPVAMQPALSARFDAVWVDLKLPAMDRLDLAVKYSSLEHSSRLPDAVQLWEVASALIKEREELVHLTRIAVLTPKATAAMVTEETALLQDLAASTRNVKEAILLTFIEVGDFVSLAGEFYLSKMEREAGPLCESIAASMEANAQVTATGMGTAISVNGSMNSGGATGASGDAWREAMAALTKAHFST